jgi:crotonobetainyl-CoA:carnitine CoA-transferase CaiB-like acyl-CoA transferase
MSRALGADSANFALLNRGKSSVAIDLKAPDALARLTPLLKRADVLIEQFRPGVMERLGLGYEAVRTINDQIIYCSISGFGQSGRRRDMAGHDLNYMALTGLLSATADTSGAPSIPTPVLIADIAGGSYPAVMNVLLALIQRKQTGQGSRLDISMTGLLGARQWLRRRAMAASWRRPGDRGLTPVSNLSHRGWWLHVGGADRAAILGCILQFDRDPSKVIAAVAAGIAAQPTEHWRQVFAEQDACCAIVATLGEAVRDPHFRARNLFDRQTGTAMAMIPALPLPIADAFRDTVLKKLSPALGADNHLITPA